MSVIFSAGRSEAMVVALGVPNALSAACGASVLFDVCTQCELLEISDALTGELNVGDADEVEEEVGCDCSICRCG